MARKKPAEQQHNHDALIEELRNRTGAEPLRLIGRLKVEVHPPLSHKAIEATEALLGFNLPMLLRRIYAEVADGGFGPAYGLFPIASHCPEGGQHETLVEVLDMLAEGRHPAFGTWPSQLVPLCDWGCANWSCLDCQTENGPVVTLAGEDGLFDTGRDLASWLTAWLRGVHLWEEMFEPQGAPRGRRWARSSN